MIEHKRQFMPIAIIWLIKSWEKALSLLAQRLLLSYICIKYIISTLLPN